MFFSVSDLSGVRSIRRPVVAGVGAMLLLIGLAQAQHDHAKPTTPTPPDATIAPPTGTTDPSARPAAGGTPIPLRFDSVLSRYKPMTDQKLGLWRDANDTVTRIGGWRTYLKEAQTPAAPATTAPSATPPPAAPGTPATPNPHAGHGAKP